MTDKHQSSADASARDAAFQNTLWTQVFAAGKFHSPQSRQALEELCRLYWYPIYAFVRRKGTGRQEARDLTQGFFVYLLEANLVGRADPDRGRFRSFLLGILQNFLRSQKAKDSALKRGGGAKIVSIDEETAEGRYAHEPATVVTPATLFDRRWALTVLEQAIQRLRAEYARAKMGELFETLQPYLTGDGIIGFADLGARIDKSEGAARVLVFRFRTRFRQLIRAVIADTVSDLDQVEQELKHLQAVLREN